MTEIITEMTADQVLIEQLKAQLATVERRLGYAQSQIHEYASQIHRITERLHQEANDRGMCSDFDDIMDDLGLERREKEFEVRISVEHYITVTVTARDEDSAIEQAEEDAKQRVLDDLRYSDFDNLTVETC